jgi:hypothetical protein
MKRPRFQRKHDRFTGGGASPADIAVDHALAPFDRLARLMDAKWGIDRLPGLVSVGMAAKYGRTLASLNAAIDTADEARAAARTQACNRGMLAMDAEALAAGHTPPTSGVLEHDLDGWRFGVLPDPTMWRIAEREHPDLPTYTLREIGVIIRANDSRAAMIAATKAAFPGAEVTAIRPKGTTKPPTDETLFEDSEIPF